MQEAAVFAKFEALYTRYLQQNSWQQAVQNRIQAASFAQSCNDTGRFSSLIESAIDMAREHRLFRLELNARNTRFTYGLMRDLTGQVRDDLEAELNCELTVDGAVMTGSLVQQLESYGAECLSAYDQARIHNPPSIGHARDCASAFALVRIAGLFDEAIERPESLAKAVESARSETLQIVNSIRIDLYLLIAQLKIKTDRQTARDVFEKAAEQSASLPEKRVSVFMAWSDYADTPRTEHLAIRYAEQAVDASRLIASEQLRVQAQAKLDALVERRNPGISPPKLEAALGASGNVSSILDRAHQCLLDRRFDDSLVLLEQALTLANRPQLRRMVLRIRALVWMATECMEEAGADLDETISLLSSELKRDSSISDGALDSRIREQEDLYLMRAYVWAKLDSPVRAWNAAEDGRAQRLKLAMATPPPTFEVVRQWLHVERVAMISFAATTWGTLVLSLGPDDETPEATLLESFPARVLRRLLDSKLDSDSTAWTETILGAIPELSAALIDPIRTRLQQITQSARVLYVIPDSQLSYAPFAALIDLCPLAIVPSVAVPLWCASRRRPAPTRSCLTVGVGSSPGADGKPIEFHDHLDQVAKAPWPTPPLELRDGDATRERVSGEAAHYPVLYFSCHGTVSHKANEMMEASQLKLAGDQVLSARDVASWKIHADLVFLNACQSGRFRLEARSDVSGFVRAFLLAGANTLIAPVTHVDPMIAGEIAEVFFREWLGGKTAAESLRIAQHGARASRPEQLDWAAYHLIGDY